LNSPTSLVQPLFDGPIDIVGDVHGEIDALRDLLGHLRYADDGSHPEGRRLVFLGDLTDRGPDSPTVVELVERLVKAGRAQCVLGNHDLNILLGYKKLVDVKHDNHWFFGEEWSLDGKGQPITPAVPADDNVRQSVIDFFKTLPLALERDDVRVVHACWDVSMVEIVRQSPDVLELYRQHESQISADHNARPDLDEIDKGLEHQNRNPVKVLSSGKERRIKVPFEASGKLRYEERVRWWEDYDAEPLCVFGHYSNYRGETILSSRAICADFAVAKRWQERKQPSFNGTFRGCLGAVRIPEMSFMFDKGEIEPIKLRLTEG
jgi:hypothetical protein